MYKGQVNSFLISINYLKTNMASMHDQPFLKPNCSSLIFYSAVIFNLSFKIAAYILEAVAKSEIPL
jgi:hypothetical protein